MKSFFLHKIGLQVLMYIDSRTLKWNFERPWARILKHFALHCAAQAGSLVSEVVQLRCHRLELEVAGYRCSSSVSSCGHGCLLLVQCQNMMQNGEFDLVRAQKPYHRSCSYFSRCIQLKRKHENMFLN